MNKITIQRFRQIRSLSIEIKDILVFIGPQASGKSTLSKLVYFFNRIPINMILFMDTLIETKTPLTLNIIEERLIEEYFGIFGKDEQDYSSDLKYVYGTGLSIMLQGTSSGIHFVFCDEFAQKFDDLLQRLAKLNEINSNAGEQSDSLNSKEFNEIVRFVVQEFKNVARYDYIPAGRMLVSYFRDLTWAYTRADFLNKDTIKLERVVSEFYNTISRIRNNRKDEIMPLEDSEIADPHEEIFFKINRIMKGNVLYKKDSEIVRYDKTHSVNLNQASSGQQEVLWILLLMLNSMIDRLPMISYIVEEPEAHLYPSTQKDLIEFMIMWQNITNSKLILTTHSPYVLTVLNNLILAKQASVKSHEKVNSIVKDFYWVDFNDIGVYYLDNNSAEYAHDLLDKELQMIDDSYIDEVSNEINSIYHELSKLNT